MKKFFNYFAIPAATAIGLYFSFTIPTVHAGDPNKIYKDTCELCHGADGKGTEAGKQFGVPDFSNPDYQRSRTDADMKESMTKGTKNPNYVPVTDLGVELGDLDALIKIVRGFGK